MSARQPLEEHAEPDPELARALEALAAQAPRPQFVERLRQQFVRGSFGTQAAREHEASAPAGVPNRFGRWQWVGVAAALVLVLGVISWLGRDSAPAWQVLEGTSARSVVVNETTYPIGDAKLARALGVGARIATSSGRLRLRIDERLIVELGPESELEILRFPRSGAPGSMELAAHAGSLAFATGPGFAGSTLLVRSPDVDVVATGTAFGVDVFEEGTCVCCSDGDVRVHARGQVDSGAKDVTVACGRMGFLQRRERTLTAADALEDHLRPVLALSRIWP